jgi:3-hydroxyisobutyrate dehydrogenase-like beta-hydroxyacid dehydrogenase
MKIGILGAGAIGGALARNLTRLGHQVAVANSRGPETLQDVAATTGARAATAADAVKGAELIVVTIPQKNVLNLPKDLFGRSHRRPSSSTRGTTIRRSATGRSWASRAASPRAAGSRSSSGGRW